ncbi:MAG: hypothetical protein JWQ64_2377 [Subtercola sp.]|nr:hypothetical protein [Subtercola sp.]
MSRTPLLSPSLRVPSDATVQVKLTCPFGANCSCVFSRNQASESVASGTGTGTETPVGTEAAHDDTAIGAEAMSAEVMSWRMRGWRVAASTAREATLERQQTQSFCVNVALTLLTGFLWLAYWIPRARHPKIDTWVVAVSDSGEITRTQVLPRRRLV